MNEKITRAMILAAGLGTRFKPWTDRHPKALALVNGKSLLQRNIEFLRQYGIEEVVVNVHHFADQIIRALEVNNGWGCRYWISDETAEVLETGGGLKKARPFLEGSPFESPLRTSVESPLRAPFVLMNVDILTDMDLSAMIADHMLRRPLATLAVTERVTSRYLLFGAGGRLCGWRNTTTGQERMVRDAGAAESGPVGGPTPFIQKAFSGIHVIDPAIFSLMTRDGKFSMVDLYLDLAADHPIRAHDHSWSRLIDVGKPESVEQAARLFP